MHQMRFMRGPKSVRDLDRNVQHFAQLHRRFSQAFAQRLAFDEFADDVGRFLADTDFMDHQNVRMIQSGRGLRS